MFFLCHLTSELFHGRVWHENSRFSAPMAVVSQHKNIFVNDFVILHDSNMGPTVAKILKFYQKVRYSTRLVADMIPTFCFVFL